MIAKDPHFPKDLPRISGESFAITSQQASRGEKRRP